MLTVTLQHLPNGASSSNFISIIELARNKMLDFKLNQVKTSVCVKTSLMLSGLNWRTPACLAEVITVTPEHLAFSPLSSNFISNIGLTKNKMLVFNFIQKNFNLSKLCLMLSGLNSRRSACLAVVITATPQHLAISALSSNFISNVGLTRNKMHNFKLKQVKTAICQKLSWMLSGLNCRPSAC